MGETATKHLIKSYLDKNKKPKKVQAVTRSTTSTKAPIQYSEQLATSYNEDERASDLSYQPTSDSDLTDREDSEAEISSDEELPDKPYAPVGKCLNSPTLLSSPRQPNNQTILPLSPTAQLLNLSPIAQLLPQGHIAHLIPQSLIALIPTL